MAGDKIIELGRHEPSVDSVIERLDRYRGRINNITAIITWDDGSTEVVHDTKTLRDVGFESLFLNNYFNSALDGEEGSL